MRVLSILCTVIILHSCSEGNKKNPVEQRISTQTINIKKLTIQPIGELRFRKSYAAHQTIPSYYYAEKADSFLLKRFRTLGYLNNNYDLLTKKLRTFKLFNVEKPDTIFNLTDNLNNKISCQIKKADSVYQYDLFIKDSSQNALHKVSNKFILPGLQFKVFDIIQGGFEEVILLDAYYIINGDNFDFFIYEIKYN